MNAEAEFQMKDTALNYTIAQIVGMCRYLRECFNLLFLKMARCCLRFMLFVNVNY